MSSARRKTIACVRCHGKKIKCPGGLPCQNCCSASADCSFPVRDRNVLVSEAYLANLQAMVSTQSQTPLQHTSPSVPVRLEPDLNSTPRAMDATLSPTVLNLHEAPVLKNSTAEAFVSGLKKLGARTHGSAADNALLDHQQTSDRIETDVEDTHYDYVPLNFDTSTSRVTVKLPPYPYALQLVKQFETYIGYEYHWYLLSAFHMGLEATYRQPHSVHARDRIWLCKLLTVLALGESYNSCPAPSIHIDEDERQEGVSCIENPLPPILPGAEFFEQALSLFKIPSEEPTIAHVEALNLIAFYCYSLNRRKTAFTYTGLAVRLASVLMLHKPATSKPPATAEHHRRLWWTTFLLNTMTSSEVGLRAPSRLRDTEQSFPSDAYPRVDEQEDFRDSDILTSHLKLCDIRNDILDVAGQLHQHDFTNYHKAVHYPLRLLEHWREEMPARYSFSFAHGIPPAMLTLPCIRSLASLYLRFHQGYILLLRPVFFKLLALALGKVDDNDPPADSSLDCLFDYSSRCLEAAKCNMRILMDLSRAHRIAKYGFWESLHLFSAINIFSLARLAHALRPFSLYQDDDDLSLYTAAKTLLHTIAAHGNVASKGHVKLVDEIEQLLDVVVSSQSSTYTDRSISMTMADVEQDIFQWIENIDSMDHYPV